MIVPTTDRETIIQEALRRVQLLLPNYALLATVTPLNIPNTIVERDGSGNFAAGTITATLTGTATKVSHALTAGAFLTSGGTFDGAAARTFAVDATSANTVSKVVARDVNGDFAARYITQTRAVIGAVGQIGDTGAGGIDIWNVAANDIRFLDHAFSVANLTIQDGGAVVARTSLQAPTLLIGGVGKILDSGSGNLDIYSPTSGDTRFLDSTFATVNFTVTNTGIAVTRASTTAHEGLRLTTGVQPTVGVAGAFYQDNIHVYCYLAGAWKQLD